MTGDRSHKADGMMGAAGFPPADGETKAAGSLPACGTLRPVAP
jgi:hypothetical protein